MTLGDSFPVIDSIELFGVTLDNELTFKKHVVSVCKKINNGFNAITRFAKLIIFLWDYMLRLYKAFIPPHFHYCCMVWHFCSKRESDKLDLLKKCILRFIFKDWNSDYHSLLKRQGLQVCQISVHKIWFLMYLKVLILANIRVTPN